MGRIFYASSKKLAALRSNCITRHVGAVIVRDHRQLATGYNGTPPGIKNCFEGGCKRCSDRMEGKIKAGESLGKVFVQSCRGKCHYALCNFRN